MQRCGRCKVEKEPDEFCRDRARPSGRNGWCKACAREQRKARRDVDPAYRAEQARKTAEWRLANPDRVQTLSKLRHERDREKLRAERRAAHLRQKYGLTVEAREALFDSVGRKCECCGRPEDASGGRWASLVVDHKRGTKVPRGVLCNSCNLKLGHLESNPELVEKIQLYLASR